jgi:hypothetical protein
MFARAAIRVLVALLLLAAPAAAEDLPASSLVDGEILTYRARVWKGFEFIDMEVGRATFTTLREVDGGEPIWAIVARAKGGALGYEVNTTIRSRATATLDSLSYGYEQRGSEERKNRLDFGPKTVTYTAFQHCPGTPPCAIPDHQVEEGGHCPNKPRCHLPEHFLWVKRFEHPRDGSKALDMLTAVYYARGMELAAGASRKVRIVNNDAIYDVEIRVEAEEQVEVGAGTFDAWKIILEPTFASGSERAKEKQGKFRGLFGISGSIRIWLDKKARVPVKICGTIPFGVDLNGEVDLVERSTPK